MQYKEEIRGQTFPENRWLGETPYAVATRAGGDGEIRYAEDMILPVQLRLTGQAEDTPPKRGADWRHAALKQNNNKKRPNEIVNIS